MKKSSQLKQGFTLTEVMVSVSIGMLAMAGFLSVFITFLRHSEAATVWRDADNSAGIALERMTRGTDQTTGLRQFHIADTSVVSENGNWTIIDERTDEGFIYSATDQTISDSDGNIFIRNVANSSISLSNSRLTLSVSISSGIGENLTAREYNTTIQPRNL